MRTIAFGYSTRCNIRCGHCVAADGEVASAKMELGRAKEIIAELAEAGVRGISFSAGEPLIYADDIGELLALCRRFGIYSRVVTNSFWAATPEAAAEMVASLKEKGLSQLRLSYSRWHQKNVAARNVLNAARSCQQHGLDYFISFVTDFSEADDGHEQYLRDHQLKFFPEPLIFAGRAHDLSRQALRTDYQANCCPMNPYLAPSLDMYACCDAGSHFTRTNFFHLGNLQEKSASELFAASESHPLYNHIRRMGITAIASFAGFKARQIIGYRKCELCEKLFNSPELLASLEGQAATGLPAWQR